MTTFEKYDNLEEHLTVEVDKKSFKVLYNGSPIRLQTPPLYSPFGMRVFEGKYNPACSLDLSLRGYDEEDNRNKRFLEWYRKFEQLLFEKTLFNPDQFNSSLNQSNPEYPPHFRVKLPLEDGLLAATVWKEHEELPETIYGKMDRRFQGNTAIVIINPTPYVLPNGKWGISWKGEQIRLFEPKRLRGCLFLD